MKDLKDWIEYENDCDDTKEIERIFDKENKYYNNYNDDEKDDEDDATIWM